jgi:hypothetical protein
MVGPTRVEFLSHVHQGLIHPDPDPPKGSPAKSTQRSRWRELLPWDCANIYVVDLGIPRMFVEDSVPEMTEASGDEFGIDHVNSADTINNIGLVYSDQGC